jgi:hypothetical protein
MQFLVVNKRNTEKFSEADFTPKIPLEVRRVQELYSESFIRQIWHRADTPGGILLVEAESVEGVRGTLGTLPMVAAGLVEVAMIVPLRPFAGFGPPKI